MFKWLLRWIDQTIDVCPVRCVHGSMCQHDLNHGHDHETRCCRIPKTLAEDLAKFTGQRVRR